MAAVVIHRGALPVERLRNKHHVYLYAFYDTRSGLVKIGRSRSLLSRRHQIARQLGLPDKALKILGYHITDEIDELFAHHSLSSSRICGEWFEMSAEVRARLRQWKLAMFWDKMTPDQQIALVFADAHRQYRRTLYPVAVTPRKPRLRAYLTSPTE